MVNIPLDQRSVETILDHFGKTSQISKAIEEFSELTTALARHQNNKGMILNILEEIADCMIMTEQLRILFGPDQIDEIAKMKISRTLRMIEESKSLTA